MESIEVLSNITNALNLIIDTINNIDDINQNVTNLNTLINETQIKIDQVSSKIGFLESIKVLSQNGQLKYYGNNNLDRSEKFSILKSTLEQLDDNDIVFLPSWYVEAYNNDQITILNKKNVIIICNNLKIKMMGSIRPDATLKIQSCENLFIENIHIDAGLDNTTSGAVTGYGLMVFLSKNVTVNNCNIKNCYLSDTSYAVCFDNSENCKLTNSIVANGGNGNVRVVDCGVFESKNVDSYFDIDRGPQNGKYRHFNFETRLNGLKSAKSWVVTGGRWIASGKFETNWDVNPYDGSVGGTKSFVDYCEISPSMVIHDDYTPNYNYQFGKFQRCRNAVMRNVENTTPNYQRAFIAWDMKDECTALVENCSFSSGSINVTPEQGSHLTLNVKNSQFYDVYYDAIVITDKNVSVNLDSQTQFYGCCKNATSYFLNTGSLTSTLNTQYVLDCFVSCADSNVDRIIIRYPGNIGQVRIGPNFKVVANKGTGQVYLSYSLPNPQGNRLCITQLDGVGRFDCTKKWIGITNVTHGISQVNSTFGNTHQIIIDGTNPFPNTPGKLSDKIINENWKNNGYPISWIHDGSQWIVNEFNPGINNLNIISNSTTVQTSLYQKFLLSLSNATSSVLITLNTPQLAYNGVIYINQNSSIVQDVNFVSLSGAIKWNGTKPLFGKDPINSMRKISIEWNGLNFILKDEGLIK